MSWWWVSEDWTTYDKDAPSHWHLCDPGDPDWISACGHILHPASGAVTQLQLDFFKEWNPRFCLDCISVMAPEGTLVV